MLEALTTVDHVRLPPEGAGTIKALARIGYELPAALADLLDNAIDAGARRVEITFVRDDREIKAVTVADDGIGMDAATLRVGMQFAGRTDHDPKDLGAFGLGLKSASFSQCRTLTVVSRRGASTLAGRWSVESIGEDWRYEILDSTGAAEVFDLYCMRGRTPTTGTLVVWERLDRLAVGHGQDALDEFLSTALPRLEAHLGLTFHRFLQTGALSISVVVRHERRSLAVPRPVRPHDPFGYPNPGADGWPKLLEANLPNVGTVSLAAHIWPGGAVSDNFLLGSRKGLEFQGFYFYRNNRLIQVGGWNGVIRTDHDPELVLARIAIDLPLGSLDVNVQKSALQVTAAQSHALLEATDGEVDLGDYLEAARAAYRADRRTDSAAGAPILIPGAGIPMPVRRSAQRLLAKTDVVQEVSFAWDELKEDQVFDLDLTETRIVLNRDYRSEILGGSAASSADAPVLKMLLFLLFREDLGLLRSSRKRRERVDQCNALLLDILTT